MEERIAKEKKVSLRLLVLQKNGFPYVYDSNQATAEPSDGKKLAKTRTSNLLPRLSLIASQRLVQKSPSTDKVQLVEPNGKQDLSKSMHNITLSPEPAARIEQPLFLPLNLKEKIFSSLPLKTQTTTIRIREERNDAKTAQTGECTLIIAITFRITNQRADKCDFACSMLINCDEDVKMYIYSYFSPLQSMLKFMYKEVSRIAGKMFSNPSVMDNMPGKDALPRYILNHTPSFKYVSGIIQDMVLQQLRDEHMLYPAYLSSRAFPEIRSEIEELFLLTLSGVYEVEKWRQLLYSAITAVLSTHYYWIKTTDDFLQNRERYSIPSSFSASVDRVTREMAVTVVCCKDENPRKAMLNIMSYFVRIPSVCQFYALRNLAGDRISPGSLVNFAENVNAHAIPSNSAVEFVEFPPYKQNYRTQDFFKDFDTYGSYMYSSGCDGYKNGSVLYSMSEFNREELLERMEIIAKYSELVDTVLVNVIDLNELECLSYAISGAPTYQGDEASAIVSREEHVHYSRIVRDMIESVIGARNLGINETDCIEYLEGRLSSIRTICDTFRKCAAKERKWSIQTSLALRESAGTKLNSGDRSLISSVANFMNENANIHMDLDSKSSQ